MSVLRHALLVVGLLIFGSVAADHASGPAFVRIVPEAIQWKDDPEMPGVQSATLYGDPAKPGFYVIRARFPPHVMDRPHWHPNARYVTVMQGTWYAGTGDTFDLKRAVPMPAGSVMVHPARASHWDGSAGDEPVIVQIVGYGPDTATAVDPKLPFWIKLPN